MLTRDFVAALRAKIAANKPAVIAEIKKASPSKGVLREDFIAADIAQSYAECGAACLSVLTDVQFFQGCTDFLKQARASCQLPVLRKDFMVDAYQIYESRAMGADAILLIAAALTPQQCKQFTKTAIDMGLEVLLELHDETEIDHISPLNNMIGVNNRNLGTFVTNVDKSYQMIKKLPAEAVLISESGISDAKTVYQLRQAGYKGFLIGENFMKTDHPGQALQQFIADIHA